MPTRQEPGLPRNRGRAVRAVRAVLPSTASLQTTRADSVVDFVVNGQPIQVAWIGQGHLADARAALIRRPEANTVFAARHLSPGARAALTDAAVSWVDETGAAEISIGTILVSRSGESGGTPKPTTRWTPAVIAIAETMLCGAKGTQTAMQAATGLSAGSCANALRYLTDQGLLMSTAKRGPTSARRISDLRRLLDAYATAVETQPAGAQLQIGVTWQDMLQGLSALGSRFEKEQLEYAVTGGAAAAVIAPYVTSVPQVTVYVDARTIAELNALAQRLDLRPIDGGRLKLKPFPSAAVQRLATSEPAAFRVAPWPRVYADLQGEGVRGEEAAEHLFERIGAR